MSASASPNPARNIISARSVDRTHRKLPAQPLLSQPWLVIPLLALTLFIGACAGGGGNASSTPTPTTQPASAPGSASVEIIGDCQVAEGLPEGTSCIRVSVTCEDLPAATADLRTVYHKPDTSYLGTIVLGSGGAGHSFLSGETPTLDKQATHIVLRLVEAGYDVVERKWENGWFGKGSEGLGILPPSCRHAELLKWLDSRIEQPGAMCAFGNSGGSAELAYGLTTWNTESVLDTAVLGGGPPMADLAVSCLGSETYPEWEQTCTETWRETQTDCQPNRPICTMGATDRTVGPSAVDAAFSIAGLTNLCSSSSTTFQDVFIENSILHPGADLDYPNTTVHEIFGRNDCSIAATTGPLFYEAVTSQKTIQYLDGVPHETFESESGADAIVNTLLEYCHAGN